VVTVIVVVVKLTSSVRVTVKVVVVVWVMGKLIWLGVVWFGNWWGEGGG
jgi:hypothetical protein